MTVMRTKIPTPDELKCMTDVQFKTAENLARRMATRQGLALEKCRARDPRAIGFGTYHLADLNTNTLIAWGLQQGYGLTLTEIFKALTEGREQ
jgi:hypothetical protein